MSAVLMGLIIAVSSRASTTIFGGPHVFFDGSPGPRCAPSLKMAELLEPERAQVREGPAREERQEGGRERSR